MILKRYTAQVYTHTARGGGNKWVMAKQFHFWQYEKAKEYCREMFVNDPCKQRRQLVDTWDNAICYSVDMHADRDNT